MLSRNTRNNPNISCKSSLASQLLQGVFVLLDKDLRLGLHRQWAGPLNPPKPAADGPEESGPFTPEAFSAQQSSTRAGPVRQRFIDSKTGTEPNRPSKYPQKSKILNLFSFLISHQSRNANPSRHLPSPSISINLHSPSISLSLFVHLHLC